MTLAAVVLCMMRQGARNRKRYWGSSLGLRILTFHAMERSGEWTRFQRVVELCRARYDIATPADVDALTEGRLAFGDRDKVLFTFDDGHQQDFAVAEWLGERGIRAIFFVIPSYVGKSVREFLEFHERRGVRAYDIARGTDHEGTRGLSQSQLAEMADMGHRLGAHNFAHRDLGALSNAHDLEYEIGEAMDTLSSVAGRPCSDFAWAFGSARHVSQEATRFLELRCRRVYSCVRGLNVPGVSPRFLLRDTIYTQRPLVMSRLFLAGGADHRWDRDRQILERQVGRLGAAG